MSIKNKDGLEFEIDARNKILLEVCEFMEGSSFEESSSLNPMQFIDGVIEKNKDSVFHALESDESYKVEQLGVVGYTVFGLAFLSKLYEEKDKALDLMGVLCSHIVNQNIINKKED